MNSLFLPDEINAESANTFIKEFLDILDTSPDGTIITIYINSQGGDVYSSLGIIDIFQFATKKGYIINTVNMGLAASMAAIILMSGTPGYRSSFKDSTVLIHPISYTADGDFPKVKKEFFELERLQKVINGVITENASVDCSLLTGEQSYINAEDALKYNIIDKII